MQIHGPSHLHGPQAISAPHAQAIPRSSAASQGTVIRDEVQFSEIGQLVGQIHEMPDIRADRVQLIRDQLAAGTYLTQDKVSQALDQLLDEIG